LGGGCCCCFWSLSEGGGTRFFFLRRRRRFAFVALVAISASLEAAASAWSCRRALLWSSRWLSVVTTSAATMERVSSLVALLYAWTASSKTAIAWAWSWVGGVPASGGSESVVARGVAALTVGASEGGGGGAALGMVAVFAAGGGDGAGSNWREGKADSMEWRCQVTLGCFAAVLSGIVGGGMLGGG